MFTPGRRDWTKQCLRVLKSHKSNSPNLVLFSFYRSFAKRKKLFHVIYYCNHLFKLFQMLTWPKSQRLGGGGWCYYLGCFGLMCGVGGQVMQVELRCGSCAPGFWDFCNQSR